MTTSYRKPIIFLLTAAMTMLLSFPSGTLGNTEWGLTASAAETSQPENGSGTSTDPYQITKAEELVWLSEKSNSSSVDNSSLNAVLMNDIDLDGVSFTPILENSFDFDGNNKTIKNLNTLNGNDDKAGLLISKLGENCTVKDLTIEGSVVLESTKTLDRGVIGSNEGTVRNCTNKINITETTEQAYWIGGIVGYNDETGVIEGCANYGKIIGTQEPSIIGGIAGVNYGKIDSCINCGELESHYGAGGITFSNNNKGIISNSTNTAKITSDAHYVGGICAKSVINTTDCKAKIENCYNTGELISEATADTYAPYTGGIAAYIESLYDSSCNIINNCYNLGTITDAAGISGGIVAAMGDYSEISNCYHAGKINSAQYASVIGAQNRAISATTNTNTYDVSGVYILNETGWYNAYNTSKTAEEFASGEVAYLLNGSTSEGVLVWGQTLTGETKDASPVLTNDTAKAVYKVTFATEDNTEYAIKYANPSGIYEMPENPTANAGYAFYKWSKTDEANGETFTADTAVTGDMTVYAVMAELFSNADATATKKGYHNTDKGDFADSYYAEIDSNTYIIPTGLKWTVTNNESVSKDLTFTAPQVSGGTVRFGFIITGTEDELNKVTKVELNAQ